MKRGIKIVSTGRCLPKKQVTNRDLEQYVETSDEWIRSRTGIAERRFCEAETNTSLAAGAARAAIEAAGITPEEISALIVSTFTPEYATPAAACLLQHELGLREDIIGFDLNGACSGFLFGLKAMRGLLWQAEEEGKSGYGLLIGCEVISKKMDFTDRNTMVLFGDGAGAVVVRLDEGCYTNLTGIRGNAEDLNCPGSGSEHPYITMQGQEVFRFAVNAVSESIRELLEKEGRTLEEVDWIICHQANSRIIRFAAKRLGAELDKFYMNIERYGNTSAASIPIALDEMNEKGLLKEGMRVICVAFGAGFTWSASMFTW